MASGWAYYPQWAPDSRGVYFSQGGSMWLTDIDADQGGVAAATPRVLFELADGMAWGSGNYTVSNFDLAPDGKSFLMLRVVGVWQAPEHISVLTNVGTAIDEALAGGAN